MATSFSRSQQRYTLPTLIIFLVVLFGGIFYVKPLWDQVSALNADKVQKQQEQGALAKQLQDLQDLQKTLDSSSEVGKLTTLNAIPERFEQDKLIADIADIAKKNGVVLNGINFGLASDTLGKIKKGTVAVNLTGNEDSLLSFLKGVESNSRKLVVKVISVQSGKTESGVVRINFNVNMETYYQDRI